MRGNSHVRFLGGDGAVMRCLYPTNAGRQRPANGTSRPMLLFCRQQAKRAAGFSCGRLYSACRLPVSRSRDFLRAEASCGFCVAGAFKKALRRPWSFSSFARYRAGSDPCRSVRVIGASLAASMAPMAQSGGDGRWRHRAQACFLLALLYSRAPCWR